jgi:uncharacterized membrane protein YfcA
VISDGTQFLGFGLNEIAIIFLAMLLGGICKGIIGIALPLIGLTVMLLALEPKLAVAMMVIPIVLTNVSSWLSPPALQVLARPCPASGC